MPIIPIQLEGWRFIKVIESQKIPLEPEWQSKKNYSLNEMSNSQWCNYGALGGNGHIIVDIDKKSPDFEAARAAAESLPETFTVQSANGGYHYYFNCSIEQGMRMANQAGEIRAKGMYVVGPGSTAQGKPYFPVKAVPVATVTEEQLRTTFAKWLGEEKKDGVPVIAKPTDKTRSGKEFGVVYRLVKKGRTKEQVYKHMQIYDKWVHSPEQYKEHTYNAAVKRFEKTKLVGVGFGDTGRFVPKKLGDTILDCVQIKTLKGANTIYQYCDGIYLPDGKETIKEICAELLKDQYSQSRFSETVSYIEASTFVQPEEIDHEWINLENGLLNPITKEFKEHTPDVFSVIQLPISYDPTADCPLWKQKLEEKTDGPTRTVLQEMFGYVFLPGQKYQVAFLLYGPKRTMKSTSLNVLEAIIGKENTIAFSLQFLSENPFAPAYLYGKPLNICADLTTKALTNTGMFMEITGGDKISAGKKREHMMSFYPTTKLVFSCNEIPPTTNKNLAFYRRWVLLNFEKQTPEDKIDASLPEKLQKELPGILNWALDGLQRLMQKDCFSYWLSPEQVKDLYERNSDSIQSFVFNCIDMEDDEGVLKKREAYKKYKEYCRSENLRVENQIRFGKEFLNLTGCGTCRENVIPAYRGVSLKVGGGEQEQQQL